MNSRKVRYSCFLVCWSVLLCCSWSAQGADLPVKVDPGGGVIKALPKGAPVKPLPAARPAGAANIVCASGYGDCDGNPANGCEANLSADPSNCGKCGAKCPSVNGTSRCTYGACSPIVCVSGYGNCDGNPANGCEANLSADPSNCGKCGMLCPAGQSCLMGACYAATR